MKLAIDLTIAIIFAIFAYLQLNDPDPVKWFVGYIIVTTLSVLHIAKFKYLKQAVWLAFGIYISWCVLFVPDVIDWIKLGMPAFVGEMKDSHPYIELMRELVGLILCLIAVGYYWKQGRKLLES